MTNFLRQYSFSPSYFFLGGLFFALGCTNKVSYNTSVAEAYMKVGQYANALSYYEKVYKNNQDPKIAIASGKALFYQREYAEALLWVQKVSEEELGVAGRRFKADVLKRNGHYFEARNLYPSEPEQDYRSFVNSCDSALHWLENPREVQVENIHVLNTEHAEMAPAIYENFMVFCSSRDNVFGKTLDGTTNEPFFDLFESREKEGKWSKPQAFSAKVNTPLHEGSGCFSQDGTSFYFTRSGSDDYTKEKKDKVHHLKMFKVHRTIIGWQQAESFMLNDGAFSVGQPSLGRNDQVFVFASDQPDGFGGADLYISFRKGDGWTLPKNMGPEINSTGNECYPYLTEEGRLFFSSDHHPGMGGYDVFTSSLVKEGWQIPKNLGFPINSGGDDFGFCPREGTTSFFLSSNRKGGKGKEDIYQGEGLSFK